MDFIQICAREIEKGPDKGKLEIFPDFVVGRSKDIMVRGRSFYAIWDEETKLWSTDEYDVQRLVDTALSDFAEEQRKNGVECKVKYLRSFGNNGWSQFRKFLNNVSDNSKQLDMVLTFANTETKKEDYVSRRLPYALAKGKHNAWDELVGYLYLPEEREKIEWAIGAVISGEARKIQKFLVFHGPGGTGKSTVLNIIQKLFEGYYTSFEAKALVGNNNSFATEVFKANPLVAIQHDGDLSKIEDNGKLNSIISHEEMTMNEKYKSSYTAKIHAFLFMGTNKPVKVSDAKSGIIRRLIDVYPTGEKLAPNHYHALMSQIDFELGAIAEHCLSVFKRLGKNYYNAYRPLQMMLQTDVFFNFIEANFDIFKEQDGTSLKQAYALYKEYCSDTGIDFVLPQYKFREELRNYFEQFHDRTTIDGTAVRSYYSGFTAMPFKVPTKQDSKVFALVLDETTSLLDLELAEQPAQLAKEDGTPRGRWALVKTTLADIDTSQLHYTKVPRNHIVIDFDLKDEDGNKSRERNLAAAAEWPPTYGEFSKSGSGVHLHYRYTGSDFDRLAVRISDGIELKTFTGDSSLRRALSFCNGIPIADIAEGLPLKEKKMLAPEAMKSEKSVRALIARTMEKEFHAGTKPAISFIHQILEDAYLSGMQYDVSDLRNSIAAFANNSSHQQVEALRIVKNMRFKSDDSQPPWRVEPAKEAPKPKDERPVIFDVEVYPNLFVICWKYLGGKTHVKMINPSPQECEALLQYKLIGFNNRRYDNHMIYARILGYDNEALYKLSQKIIDGNVGSMFGEAYGLSFADIYDFSTVKQSLKKFGIQLRMHHMEMDIPWDQPVPKDKIDKVVEYCCNDVDLTEATFYDRQGDYMARQILADLSGLDINDTTQKHTARIVFGEDRNPQRDFNYTRLAEAFPGYIYDAGKSTYRGETVGEGGYVYAEPGMYDNVALLDVASMHPTSIHQLDLFGPYTPRFAELTAARLAIKRKNYDEARTLLGGKLAKYLVDTTNTKALSDALKIAINIVYGLTSAKFDNPFRDPRNKDNIVAKRGALFMIDLKHAVQEQGFTVAHIKTDSIKIPDATPEIIQFVKDYGEKWGYTFEHEATYEKFCLVNDAVYVARKQGEWIAVGAQFQHPYIFKTLFTREPVELHDLYEAKQVTQGAMYLDFEHDIPGPPQPDRMHFVGRTGQFVPVREGVGGGVLYRVKDGKIYAVSGTKGYLWLESELAEPMIKDGWGTPFDTPINMNYFEKLAADAVDTIDYFGPFADFVR